MQLLIAWVTLVPVLRSQVLPQPEVVPQVSPVTLTLISTLVKSPGVIVVMSFQPWDTPPQSPRPVWTLPLGSAPAIEIWPLFWYLT